MNWPLTNGVSLTQSIAVVTFGDYGSIQLGGIKGEMHHFANGHTRGDTIVFST